LLSLLFALCSAAAQASATQEEDIAEATRLFERGRFEEAQAIVTRLRAVPDAALQVLFLSGALHVQSGRHAKAAEEFRLILAKDPSLIRPRLELARAHFMAGDYDAARYHFEQTLAAPLPEAVKGNVLSFLRQIREHLPSYAVSLELVSDSNPKQATSSKVVELGGRQFQLNDDARAQKALGVLFVGQTKIPLPSDTSWFMRGNLVHYDYEGRSLDLSYAQLLGGKHYNLGRHSLDLEAGAHLSGYGGKTLYDGVMWRASDFVRIRPAVGVTLSMESKELRYPEFTFLSGWQHMGSAEVRYAPSPKSSVSAALSHTRGTAQERAYAFDGNAVDLRYLHEWKGGWIGSATFRYARYKFDDIDPFFGNVRSDVENRLELGVVNRYLSYKRFSPRLTIGTAERRSNINLYAFNRAYVRVGFVTEY